jgi:hypothetical protein
MLDAPGTICRHLSSPTCRDDHVATVSGDQQPPAEQESISMGEAQQGDEEARGRASVPLSSIPGMAVAVSAAPDVSLFALSARCSMWQPGTRSLDY